MSQVFVISSNFESLCTAVIQSYQLFVHYTQPLASNIY